MSPPRRPSPGMSARLLAVLLAVVLARCGVENQPNPPPATGGPVAAALSFPQLATLPGVQVPGRARVAAGTGSRFITVGGAGVGRYSADNGRTWTDLPAELAVRADLQGDGGPSFGSLMGYQGTFAGLVASADPSGGSTWDCSVGTRRRATPPSTRTRWAPTSREQNRCTRSTMSAPPWC